MTDRELARNHWRLLKPHRWIFLVGVICMVLSGLTEPLVPLLLGSLLDAGGDHSGRVPAISTDWLPFAFLALALARFLFLYGNAYISAWLDATVQADLRRRCGERFLNWPGKVFAMSSPGDVTNKIMHFTSGMMHVAIKVLQSLVQDSFKLIGYLGLLFYLNWKLSLLLLVVMPAIIFTVRNLAHMTRKKTLRWQQDTIGGTDDLNEAVRLWSLIKGYGGEALERRRQQERFARLRHNKLKIQTYQALAQPMSQLLLAVVFTYIIAQVIAAMDTGAMSPGDVATFISAMLLLYVPVRNLSRLPPQWAQAKISAEAVFGFIERPVEVDAGQRVLERARGELSFSQVRFSYPDASRPALDGVSLTIRPAETIALVGSSGAGKTTLTSLLPRFQEPQQGRVTLDGIDLHDLTLASLRRQITLIGQEPLLFDTTVAANVAYPDENGDPARIRSALAAASADFVDQLPDGLYSRVGLDGVLLSGGQRQRLALARAFYKDTPVVVLDEPTASLDATTEHQIKKALRHLFDGRTAIIIAHRFSLIDLADRICVLQDGRLLAEGTLDELMRSCPLFRDMYEHQRLRKV